MKNFEPFIIKLESKFITVCFVLLISYVGNNTSYNWSEQAFGNIQYINPSHGFSLSARTVLQTPNQSPHHFNNCLPEYKFLLVRKDGVLSPKQTIYAQTD